MPGLCQSPEPVHESRLEIKMIGLGHLFTVLALLSLNVMLLEAGKVDQLGD